MAGARRWWAPAAAQSFLPPRPPAPCFLESLGPLTSHETPSSLGDLRPACPLTLAERGGSQVSVCWAC